MAYNRANLLQRIIEVQNIVLEYKKKGLTQKRIFEDYIRNQYFISYSTFNAWLSTPAKTEYKELQQAQNRNSKQTANG